MGLALSLSELCIFLYLTNKTLKDSDNIVYNILFCYLCQILNYKLIGGLAWISIGVSLYPSDCTILLMVLIWVAKGMRIKKRAYISIHQRSMLGYVIRIQLRALGQIAHFPQERE